MYTRLRMGRFLSAALMASLIFSGARADDASIKKEVEAQYTSLARHYQQKDFMAFVTCTTEDARLYQILGGRITRAELASRMRHLKNEVKSVESARFTVTKWTLKGKEAVVEVTFKGAFTREDPAGDFGKKGQTHHISNTILSRDTWIKNGADWKMRASEQLSHKRQVDGKSQDPMPPAPSKE